MFFAPNCFPQTLQTRSHDHPFFSSSCAFQVCYPKKLQAGTYDRTHLYLKQVDRGTDDRVVKIALVKSNLARDDLPEDLGDIVFPVSANYTSFHVKSSLSILRTNGGSTFLALLWDLRSGANLHGCVVRIAGWMHLE